MGDTEHFRKMMKQTKLPYTALLFVDFILLCVLVHLCDSSTSKIGLH